MKSHSTNLLLRSLTFCVLLLLIVVANSKAAEWQWSAEVDSITIGDTTAHPRAFLWIPPDCQRVRAVGIFTPQRELGR